MPFLVLDLGIWDLGVLGNWRKGGYGKYYILRKEKEGGFCFPRFSVILSPAFFR
jgi:hypothetical protein